MSTQISRFSTISYGIILIVTAIIIVLIIGYLIPNPHHFTCLDYEDYLENKNPESNYEAKYQEEDGQAGCEIIHPDGHTEWENMQRVRRTMQGR